MIKKLQSLCITLFLGSGFAGGQLIAQSCGFGAPSQQWEESFSKQVEIYLRDKQAVKSSAPHTIPVVVHIVHFGETVGTFPNIDSNQVKSQIAALNDDFAGTGYNSSNVPPAFASLKVNTNIKFCLAATNYSGAPMLEKGINRVNAATQSWQSPATATLNLQQYFNSTIIPATIWDPTRYLNIWVSDRPATETLNGFGTYPPQSGLVGLFAGNYGTANNDGVWIYGRAFGTLGAVQAPTDRGRTATHEIGHWLGLRHIWGDGNCLSDYANDTPPSKGPHTGCVSVPTPPDACGVGQSPNGEMPMNFMDRSDDDCMYMFTPDQNVRMHTALSISPQRNLLGTHGLCNASPAPASSSAVAAFVTNSAQCIGGPFIPFNTSSGYPNPTYLWSISPAASFSPAATVANPMITLSNAGSYTLTLVATNSVSTSSYSMLITATGTCAPQSACLDSVRMVKKTDTLTVYNAPNSNSVLDCLPNSPKGFLAGTNCYKDREFAQYYPPSSYSAVAFPQVHSVIVLFDSAGTKGSGAGQVSCKIYGGTGAFGPGGNAIGMPKTESLATIVASTKTTSVNYIGKPGYVIPNKKIIPYKFDFNQPIIINSPSSGFFVSVQAPLAQVTPFDSISIFTDTKTNLSNDSSAWVLTQNSNWRTLKTHRGAKVHLAIIPQISCSPLLGVEEQKSVFASNINVMPNPGTGIFNLVFTLPKEENSLYINIYNALGQQISSETFSNVSSSVMNLDLSSRSNGIYFAEISNGSEKVVKKIVISR